MTIFNYTTKKQQEIEAVAEDSLVIANIPKKDQVTLVSFLRQEKTTQEVKKAEEPGIKYGMSTKCFAAYCLTSKSRIILVAEKLKEDKIITTNTRNSTVARLLFLFVNGSTTLTELTTAHGGSEASNFEWLRSEQDYKHKETKILKFLQASFFAGDPFDSLVYSLTPEFETYLRGHVLGHLLQTQPMVDFASIQTVLKEAAKEEKTEAVTPNTETK
jgi:hypothetical protein